MATITSALVGSNPIVASGSAVLGPEDNSAEITLENLTFRVAFSAQKSGAVSVSTRIIDQKILEILISGAVNIVGGTGWNFPNIATFHKMPLNLVLHVAGVGDQAEIRIINYTFTSRNPA